MVALDEQLAKFTRAELFVAAAALREMSSVTGSTRLAMTTGRILEVLAAHLVTRSKSLDPGLSEARQSIVAPSDDLPPTV